MHANTNSTKHYLEGASSFLPSPCPPARRCLTSAQVPVAFHVHHHRCVDHAQHHLAATWLTDCRSLLPESVQFYGIDIESKLFPAYASTPPNTHFSVGSATSLPSYWTSKFSLVNQRLLILALTTSEWQKVISEIYRVLEPGGYAQFIEIDSKWYSGPKTAAHVAFLSTFLDAKGLDLHCCEHISRWMTAVGFVGVRSKEVTVKIGTWAGPIGEEARDASIGALRGMKGPVMKAGGMGYVTSPEEFDAKVDAVAEEWDRTVGSHRKLKVFYGMKPVQISTRM